MWCKNMDEVLILNNISYSYHTKNAETLALDKISFSVEEGNFISIVGPSGCGKSTLLSIIAGIEKEDSGTIFIKSQYKIGYMLQHDHLFDWLSVYENVILGLKIQKNLNPETSLNARYLLDKYGLHEFITSKPSELSGGMRQRVALIRTLALMPDILLLDEPFSALDYQTRLTVCNDIATIIKNEHKTALMVTHDLAEAISVGDIIHVLTKRPGKIKCSLPIGFNEDNNTPITRRNHSKFNEYFNLLWKELDN